MSGGDFSQCLSMAAYTAFSVIRDYLARHPDISPSAAIETVRRTDSDAAALNFEAGLRLYEYLGADARAADVGLKRILAHVLKNARPWWLRLVPYGRDHVRAALSEDQLQCFRQAGLFDAFPDQSTVAWWDEIAALVRGDRDAERMVTAREAERLSLEYERDRLKRLSIKAEPEWVSLEDNTLGYDIRSYDRRGDQIVSRLIEVKSMSANTIYVTRNEWNNADTARIGYCFHVWKFPEARILEIPVSDIEPNIPRDHGTGVWQNVLVELEAPPTR